MANIGLSRSPAALDGPVRTFAGIVLPRPPTSVSNEAARDPHAPAIFTCPQPPDIRHLQISATLRRPQSSDTCHPRILHLLELRFRNTSTTTSNVRPLPTFKRMSKDWNGRRHSSFSKRGFLRMMLLGQDSLER
jgi:hypothetical protein